MNSSAPAKKINQTLDNNRGRPYGFLHSKETILDGPPVRAVSGASGNWNQTT
jgi:hypothetical protein